MKDSEIVRRETGVFCYSRQHARADFFTIVEGKDVIRRPGSLQDAMGSGLPLDGPAPA
jgi:hypothetical protein